jgi:hypothetical protein
MILNLNAQVGLNHLNNSSILKTVWFLKMKIWLLILICLKKTNMLFQLVMLNAIE